MALWAITLNIDVVMIEPIPQTSLSVSECIPPTHNKQLNRNVEHRRFENGRLHALNPFAEKQKEKKKRKGNTIRLLGFLGFGVDAFGCS